jgi:hypothetical protein
MTLKEKEKHISGIGAPWADLAARAKIFCDESIARIPQTELSTNPKWDREFKAGVQKSYRDGYDRTALGEASPSTRYMLTNPFAPTKSRSRL